MDPISLSVILPVYNEEENLALVVDDAVGIMEQCAVDFEILLCNDGSTDGTAEVCQQLITKFPGKVRHIRHQANRGYGAALRSGFDAATKELVFFTDSDGQFRFNDLPRFLDRSAECDMVIGYREQRRDPWHRTLNSRIGNRLARWMLGVRVKDINCAYKVFRRNLLSKLPLQSEGALINTELLAFANLAQWTFVELPVKHYPRQHGKQTGANPRVILRTFAEYFELKKRLSAKHSAMAERQFPAV